MVVVCREEGIDSGNTYLSSSFNGCHVGCINLQSLTGVEYSLCLLVRVLTQTCLVLEKWEQHDTLVTCNVFLSDVLWGPWTPHTTHASSRVTEVLTVYKAT